MKSIKLRLRIIYLIAFFRVAVGTAIDLASPLYYSQEGLRPEIIGVFISLRFLLSFIASLTLKNLPKRIGLKNCLIICASGFLIVQIFLQVSLTPILAFILLSIDGFLLGLFWFVSMNSISIISNLPGMRGNKKLNDKAIKDFNLSWNMGGIFSFLLNAFMLFFVAEILLIFDITLVYSIIIFILIFFFKKLDLNNPTNESERENEILKSDTQNGKLEFPIYIPLFLITLFVFLLSSNGLIYPLKSESLNFPIFTNYFFFFIRITLQTILVAKISSFSINRFKKITPYVIGIVALCFLIMGFNENLFVFGIIFAIIGFCFSFFFMFSFKLTMYREIAENNSKYSSYFQSMMGFNFFLAPLITGFVAAIELNLAYFFLTTISVTSLIVYLLIKKKIIIK